MSKIVFALVILFTCKTNRADISHLFTPDYAIFPPQAFQIAFQHPQHIHQQQQQQGTLPSLYGPPQPAQPPQSVGYPNPVTPAPVAPLPSTTEFFIPEIVENRSQKDQVNFIPLQSQYLPPEYIERPNYESPKPPQSIETDHNQQYGYHYQRPSTTTERPSPIVVAEPPFSGYDYNAPPAPPIRPITQAPVYLPPPANIAANDFPLDAINVVESGDGTNALRMRIKEMRCMQSQLGGGYFRAALKVDNFLTATPTVDNDTNDKRCELKLLRGFVIVDFTAADFIKCGVRACGKDLCLRLRFPVIRGMRTGNDAILTLHCKIQERVAVKTHALKMGVSNDVQSRSIGTYAHGGAQNPLRTHVELLRHSKNGYTRQLEPHGTVQLGEDLLIRAHVVPGDGWNYTKLGDVSLQRISTSGELLNTANLVTARGCLNPAMQSICNQPPIFDAPLGHKFHFKAIMFQGMHSGDELVISMKITGCLEQQDCYVSQEECNSNQFGSLGRRRRDTALERNKENEVSEISRISFRVIMEDLSVERSDKPHVIDTNEDSLLTVQPRAMILACSVGFVLLLICLGLIAAWKFNI